MITNQKVKVVSKGLHQFEINQDVRFWKTRKDGRKIFRSKKNVYQILTDSQYRIIRR